MNIFGHDQIGCVDVSWSSATPTHSRQYFTKDHLGSIRHSEGWHGVMVAARNYYPYGELQQEYVNSSYNARYKFTGKERDVESGLDYFGARYYNSELGRWYSVDPMADKYHGWSPYNYCKMSPEQNLDVDGFFDIPMHAYIVAKAKCAVFGGDFKKYYAAEFVHSTLMDGPLAYCKSVHLDNMSNKQIWAKINSVGFDNFDQHTICNFYAHSNYVDLWQRLVDNNKVTGEMPIFEQLSSNPIFEKLVKSELRTTDFHIEGSNYDHDEYSKDKLRNNHRTLQGLAINGAIGSLTYIYIRQIGFNINDSFEYVNPIYSDPRSPRNSWFWDSLRGGF